MRTHRIKSIGALLTAGLFALPTLVQAQATAHYVPGSEGLKAATLPPPGFWLRDYNGAYYADHINNAKNDRAVNQTVIGYANIPRVLWITDVQVLDGYLGMDALLPFKYTDLRNFDQTFGVGDFFFEGSWSWHLKQFDLAVAAGFWAPTGDYSPSNPTLAGNGYWGEMLTAGATWYPDEEKRWSVSALNRYEFNQEQQDTGVTPGQAYTVEGGISYGITKTIDIGPIAYYQQKVTGDSGNGAPSGRNRVAGVGPEVSVFFPKIMLGVSLRYAYEFLADNRFQGNTFMLTLTKKF